MPSASFILEFLYKQLFTTPIYPTTDLTGRTYIITGGNTGLGKEAARHIARLNAEKVIITSRDAVKGAAAKADIEKTTGKQGVVEVWDLDLNDYDNIRAFAKRVEGLKRIDGIIENAAKVTFKWEIVNGYESTIAVNVLATLYLTLLLMPKLRSVAKQFNITPTLTTVSSEVHFFTPFTEREEPSILDAINVQSAWKQMDRYPLSKLLQVYGTREIAKEAPVERDGVIVNFVNPGLCRSELSRELDTLAWRIQTLLLARTTEVGGRSLVYAVTAAGDESHGHYIDNCKVKPCAELVEGPEGPALQARVWAELRAELERVQPGIMKNINA